jgi:hypothetical protein
LAIAQSLVTEPGPLELHAALQPSMRPLARLQPYLVPRVTAVQLSFYAQPGWVLLRSGDARLAELGITVTGEPATVAVRSMERKLGAVQVQCSQSGLLLVFDNEDWAGSLLLSFRAAGADCLAVFHLRGAGDVVLQNVLLR